MSTFRHVFSVLTPTLNRADTLRRVYESLCEQTFQDFEWLVIDDGSTDNTRECVAQWQQQSRFPIYYHWQPTQHKKTAFNLGVRHAMGEWLVVLDSDDTLAPNALYDMAQMQESLPTSERDQYVAVTGLCARPDGSIVGDMFPDDVFDASSLDLTFRYGVTGEKFSCLRTDIVRQFPFPEDVPGFVPESLVWRAIARAGYLNRFVNQVYRVYYDSPDSLSRQDKSGQQHALGLWLLAHDTLVGCLPWFRYAPAKFLMAAARYTRFWLHLRHQPHQALMRRQPAGGVRTKLLIALMAPAGAALYVRDRLRC